MSIDKKTFERYRRACSQEEDRLTDLMNEYKQDAKRYRWLRAYFSNSHFLDHMTIGVEPLGADEVDAAIDAALAQEARR